MEGYLGLFASAFFAATALPVFSEVVIVALQQTDRYDIFWLWVWATAGNTLGSVVNWVFGRFLAHWQDRRWFPIKERHMAFATRWYNKYGVWSLLLAWTPFLGDPLTFVAGILRCDIRVFLILVTISKGGRYAALLLAAEGLF